jgi:hypothetical protein
VPLLDLKLLLCEHRYQLLVIPPLLVLKIMVQYQRQIQNLQIRLQQLFVKKLFTFCSSFF